MLKSKKTGLFIKSYSSEPLITEEEIDKHNVNIYKVFDYCNVYYCGFKNCKEYEGWIFWLEDDWKKLNEEFVPRFLLQNCEWNVKILTIYKPFTFFF